MPIIQSKLKKKFILCYFCAVVLPITSFASIGYWYQRSAFTKEFTRSHIDTLVAEQQSFESFISTSTLYFNQLSTNYELIHLLKQFYTSNREVVYAYNSQLYSFIHNMIFYDPFVNDIIIYTSNQTASDLLPYFEPIDSFLLEPYSYADLLSGFWIKEQVDDEIYLSYCRGFSNHPSSLFTGYVKIRYNLSFFKSYENTLSDTDLYIYLNNELLYISDQRNAADSDSYLQEHLASDLESPISYLSANGTTRIDCFPVFSCFKIFKVSAESNLFVFYRPFWIMLVLSVCLLVFATVLIFHVIFRALKNIVVLSAHMNAQNTPSIELYQGVIDSDETGDLTNAFNQMAERINELSSSLLTHEIELKNAQIEALQAQLNPHFFYGTLESIHMIAEANHQDLIADMSLSFGKLMRYSLSREYLVSVNREVEFTKQYISIQEKRFYGRFLVEWDVCNLDDKWRCPKFSLFTMVENVFSHNVAKSIDCIQISIKIYYEETDLLISVSNTGPGISPERLENLRKMLAMPNTRQEMTSEHNGVSIFNINDRLKLFYGDSYCLTLDSIPDKLTTCSIRIHK